MARIVYNYHRFPHKLPNDLRLKILGTKKNFEENLEKLCPDIFSLWQVSLPEIQTWQ